MTEQEKSIMSVLERRAGIEFDKDGRFEYSLAPSSYSETVLSAETLRHVFREDDPRAAFSEALSGWADDAWPQIVAMLADVVVHGDHDVTYNEAIDFIYEHGSCSGYDPSDFFRTEYRVNIAMDTGDADRDFDDNNVLNWYGRSSTELGEKSALLWLARKFGKAEKLQGEIRRACGVADGTESAGDDPFVRSVVGELENNSCGCSMLTFLVTMSLGDLLTVRDAMLSEKKETMSVTVSKDAMCGLFDAWDGGGGTLDVELDGPVEIPLKYIWSIAPDGAGRGNHDVDGVYGLTGTCWKGTVTLPKEGKDK